jgi:hypothetical protein
MSNDCKTAQVLIPYDENGQRVVDVPNIYLQKVNPIEVFAVVDNGTVYTKRKMTFSVYPKPKPDDYVYTETEVLRWEDLDRRIKDLEDATVDTETIKEAVGEYLEENPISMDGLDVEPKRLVFRITYYDEIVEYSHTIEELWEAYLEGRNITCEAFYTSGIFTVKYASEREFVFERSDGEAYKTITYNGKTNTHTFERTSMVKSVNRKTDDVVLTAKDVGALSEEDIPKIAERAAKLVEVPKGIDVTGAEVGQIIKVAEVDESGRPIAWEPADLTGDWIPIIDVTLEEAVASVTADIDVNGNPFSVKEIMWAAKIPKDGTTHTYFIVGVPDPYGLPRAAGIQMGFNVTAADFVTHGKEYLVGTCLRMGVFHKGTSEYNSKPVEPYGSVLDGYDTGVSELTAIRVGVSNAAYSLPAGSILRVWGR